MDNPENNGAADLIEITADIVAAYVSNNSVASADLPNLIAAVNAAVRGLSKPAEPSPEPLVPAVPVRKSITPDYLISLEDGRQYKTLKRHLSGLGMTPDEYRAKWGLPRDYPMVAKNYALKRSELAKAAGLGQQRRKPAEGGTGARRGRRAAAR